MCAPGAHWKIKGLQDALGGKPRGRFAATCLGDYIQGGLAASLLHRHDVRVGVAAGMFLRECITDASLRLEVLCSVFLCYWKWGAASFVRLVLSKLDSLQASDDEGRASLYEFCWEQAEREVRPQEISVVGHRGQQTVELLPRKKVRRLGGWEAGFRSYHLLKNPAARRPGRKEFRLLMKDLRAGRLKTSCDALAEKFAASGATYKDCEPTLLPLLLWGGARYSRTRFLRWLFKAEGVAVAPSKEDWHVLAGMGSGSEKGTQGMKYEDALEACRFMSEEVWPGSAAQYGLDDLVCLLCLSISKEAVGCSEVPGPADPVTVAGDLGDLAPRALAHEQGARPRVRSKTSSEASPAASAAASSSRPPARRRPRWRAGVLRAGLRDVTMLDVVPGFALLDLLPLPEQGRLCRTSRTARATLRPRVRQWGEDCWDEVRREVCELVASDGPIKAGLTAACLSGGDVFRVLAVVCDVVESYGQRPLPAEVPLLALALTRYGMNFLLTRVQLDSLAKHLRAGGCMHSPRVEDVESLLAMRRGPPGAPSLPLARSFSSG